MNPETLQRTKAVCLNEMGHSPWVDTSRFQASEKRKLINLMKAKYDTMTEAAITDEFNILVHEKILCNGAALERIPIFL